MLNNKLTPDQLLNAIQETLTTHFPSKNGIHYSYSLDMETPLPIETFVITICSIEHLTLNHITLYVPVFEDLSLIGLDSQNTLDQESIDDYNESNKRIVYGNVTLIFQFS
jgi:hypothetical protein